MCLISSLLDWISEESEPMECPVKEGYMTVRCSTVSPCEVHRCKPAQCRCR